MLLREESDSGYGARMHGGGGLSKIQVPHTTPSLDDRWVSNVTVVCGRELVYKNGPWNLELLVAT